MSSSLSAISKRSGATSSTSYSVSSANGHGLGQSREKLLGLAGWMSGDLVLGGGVVGVGAYPRLGAY